MLIDEIAKEMTREEFLESDYVFEKDNEGDIMTYKCPSNEFDLNKFEKGECEKGETFSCEKCWKNAIKDIKFKDEIEGEKKQMVMLDGRLWERFLNGEIAVNCKTEEQAKAFLEYCDKQGIRWSSDSNIKEKANAYLFAKYKEDTCFHIGCAVIKGLQYCSVEYLRSKLKDIFLYNALFETETVDHPQHYNTGKFEVIDVIEDWDMGFNLGNAIKYIARCEHKGKKKEDLEKAIWYLNRELKKEDK